MMNCHDIDRLLIAGTDPSAWPEEARKHVENCPRCQELLGLDLGEASSQAESVHFGGAPAAVAELVLSDLEPVKPLASNAVLITVITAAVAVAIAALLAVLGTNGFVLMSDFQRITFGIVLVAMLLVTAIGYEKRLVPGTLLKIAAGEAVAILAVIFGGLILWQYQRTYSFPLAAANLRCYETGVVGAAFTFLVGWWCGRRGFLKGNRAAILALCLLSAAAALLMLTIYCPLQNWRHVFIGHFGAFLTVVTVGLAARFYGARER